ncbi:class I SAM-dependent methyltransferase [Planctomyces sp. SH-PL62]|uniref:class I SAM-dependent methyltransferase n=1 Tax=Planctomyces sp. SH-PL62 TaxID=1636152 RepID=UPI00078BE746|nr:methyltransferase domain-containing protein [Planctomyces sp. SH-PL62]AMV39358.1 Methyltransferase domain protein [Planctomyces sp. SH-PL62]
MSEIPEAMLERRRGLCHKHLAGDGVEVGALHHPMEMGERARVRYVDRMDVDGLRAHYPELRNYDLVHVDVVDDGERLGTLPDASLDFIVANHFLEHTENPLGTVRNHLKKLRPGGTLYLAVPNKDHSFDRDRALTPFDHLVRDDVEGVEVSRSEHFREWARFVEGIEEPAAIEAQAKRLEEVGYSIHFHVWDATSFADFLDRARGHLGGMFQIKEYVLNDAEIIAILERVPTPARRSWMPSGASRSLRGLAARLGRWKSRTSGRVSVGH